MSSSPSPKQRRPAAESSKHGVIVRVKTGKEKLIECDPTTCKLLDFKQLVYDHFEIAPKRQRLIIYKGGTMYIFVSLIPKNNG